MSLHDNAGFAVKQNAGMNPAKAARIAEQNIKADDLYWICPDCNAKLTGPLEKIQQGCGKEPCRATGS